MTTEDACFIEISKLKAIPDLREFGSYKARTAEERKRDMIAALKAVNVAIDIPHFHKCDRGSSSQGPCPLTQTTSILYNWSTWT